MAVAALIITIVLHSICAKPGTRSLHKRFEIETVNENSIYTESHFKFNKFIIESEFPTVALERSLKSADKFNCCETNYLNYSFKVCKTLKNSSGSK